MDQQDKPSPLFEVAAYFIKLGFLGFGGPLALMAALQKDLVERRRWVAEERFSRGLALIKALPGPTSTQLAIYMGQIRGGRWGGAIAGLCLILPAFVLMLLLAVFYDSIASLSWSKPLLFGMQAAAIGVILDSVWSLTKPYRGYKVFWGAGLVAVALTAWRPAIEPLVILGSGLLGVALLWLHSHEGLSRRGPLYAVMALQGSLPRALSGAIPSTALAAGLGGAEALPQLVSVCFKAGAFVFGTGLAIVPMLAHDVVDKHHWLTQSQFLDALAFGQITPGPVLVTVTFIGYRVAGIAGALIATACVFSPAFFNILTWFPVAEERLGRSHYTKRFIMWAIAAVAGSIVVAAARLAMTTPQGGSYWELAVIVCLAFLASLKTKLPVWLVIPFGGVLAGAINFLA